MKKDDKYKHLMKSEMTNEDYRTLGFAIMGNFKHNVKEKFRGIFKREKKTR